MLSLFVSTLIAYTLSILPWFIIGIILAYFIEKNISPQIIKQYLGKSGSKKILISQILGMLSPLSIMSFLPIANEFVSSGANSGMILSFFIAERAYDLQSFFIIGSLFGLKFAILNAIAILISLLGTAYVIKNQKVTFSSQYNKKEHSFWPRQFKLLTIVICGIIIGALLRIIIPVQTFNTLTGSAIGGLLGGSILGFLLYFGPIIGNYPVAKAFADLGMSHSGVFAFLTISPVINIVVITLFGAA